MKIALFASDIVGHSVAKFFGENQEPLSCLVLDTLDRRGLNEKIISASRIGDSDRVFFWDPGSEPLDIKRFFKSEKVDLSLLAWWPYILDQDTLNLCSYGFLNFHPSLLPYNRGKDPNFWSIVEDVPFGVTIHFADSGIDCGDIAFQSEIEKTWEDSGQSLYEKSLTEIVSLFGSCFARIKAGDIPRTPQDMTRGSYHERRELDEASRIYLNKTYRARDLLNLIRARTFCNQPSAWFMDAGERCEVQIQIKSRGPSAEVRTHQDVEEKNETG